MVPTKAAVATLRGAVINARPAENSKGTHPDRGVDGRIGGGAIDEWG